MGTPEGPITPPTWGLSEFPANADGLVEVPQEYLPNLDELVTEDKQPVDNFFAEKLHRLLTEPLYSSWAGPGEGIPFLVAANVGLFNTAKLPPVVPDVMLSLNVRLAENIFIKENRSYFVWIIGKIPEVVLEIVSDRTGGEETFKLGEYARIGVIYYAIFDPRNLLEHGVLRVFALREGEYVPIAPGWLPRASLGLTLWEGEFEEHRASWLRWCDQKGNVIPTGRERADQARQLQKEQTRADRLAERLRALGVDPEA